jgi:hypothetical protein
MDFADRIQLVIFYLLSAVTGTVLVWSLVDAQWLNAFLAFCVLVLMFTPGFVERNFKIFLPLELQLFFAIFLFAALYLGEAGGYYTTFWWWDKVLHGTSGILLGIVGFLLVYILNTEPKIHMNMSPFFQALFSFAFALALGVLWEIFEFVIDQGFATDMQRPPELTDTMIDFILDAGGAFFIAFLGYFYVKKVKVPLFDRFITRFLEKNPKLFRKLRSLNKTLEIPPQ